MIKSSLSRSSGAAFALLLLAAGCSDSGSGQVGTTRAALTATPAWVQGAYATPQSPVTSVQATFAAAQTAGNLIAVVVGSNDGAAHISSIADSKGNAYALAVGPTALEGTLSQSIYYAKNIVAAAAGTNTVTVTYDAAEPFVDLRIAEYSGLDTNAPLDATAVGAGSSSSSATGNATTTGETDLIVAGTMVTTSNSGVGAGYTLRYLTVPNSDLLMDRVVTAPGVYTATAPLGSDGGWVIQLAAFKAATIGGDVTPPTQPANPAVGPISNTALFYSWGASTDNVGVTGYLAERCQGVGCSDFAQFATPTGTSTSVSGLALGTSYSFRVRARDAAGNLSAYSAVTSRVTSGDTQAPTTPTNPTANAASGTQINLSWTAATDNVGVSAYLVERCQGAGCSTFTQVASQAATTFSDTALTAATSYSYRVRARDATGYFSAYSVVATATTTGTPPAGDTTAPTAPTNPAVGPISNTALFYSWGASTDNVGVTGYLVERCQGVGCSDFAQFATPTGTSTSISGLALGTSYSFRVRATDAAGNLSSYSPVASRTTGGDTQAPTTPTSPSANATSGTQINVSWGASTDNVGVSAYLVERCQGAGCTTFAQVASQAATTFSDAGLTAATSYSYRVRATDATGYLSAYSAVASATTAGTPPPGDVTAPTAPTSPVVGPISNTALFYSWGASTDNVGVTGYLIERCQGVGCSDFALIGTATGTSMSIAGLAIGTSYSFRVRATDAAGNFSAFSVVASRVTSGDTQPPTAPTNLLANVASGTQLNLSWGVSTDNVGVSAYLVERCQGAGCSTFTQITSQAATTLSDTGLSPGTSYSYRVRATDATGYLSAYSAVATATTSAGPPSGDTQAPSAPTNPAVGPISNTALFVTWAASTDDVGVTGYLVERCQGVACSDFAQIGAPTGTSMSVGSLAAGTSHSFRIRARDAAGNLSAYSAIASRVTPGDGQPPTAPGSLVAQPTSANAINLTWTASTDNSGVSGYRIERCQGQGCSTFAQVGTSVGLTFNDPGLGWGTDYSYRVRAVDASANLSAYSNVAATQTPFDTQAPTTPTSLVANATSATQIGISWGASTDNVGVTSYLVERCQGASCSTFAQVTSQAATTLTDSGLAANTSYSYRVRATDLAGNLGGYSNVASASTSAADVQAPSTPTGLSVSPVSNTALYVQWTASTDNVGVTGYLVEQCQGVGCSDFAQVGTPATTSLSVGSLTLGTSYSYRVRATDAAGNLSGYSAVASRVTYGDTQAPTAPGTLSASASSGSAIGLTWTASTDNVSVTSYRIERCQGASCSTFAEVGTSSTTSFSSTGLSPSTTYGFRVRATDPTGNLSSYSNVASATTTSDTSSEGVWSALTSLPIVAVHSALLPNGSIIMSDAQTTFGANARVWDPVTNGTITKNAPSNVFCGATDQMTDGRIIMVGGHQGAHYGTTDTNVFDPATNTWASRAQMAHPRWYPTVMALADGRYLVVGGESNCNFCNVTQAEVYNATTNQWSSLGSPFDFPYYPHTFVLPNGKVFVSSTTREPIVSQVLDVATGSWTAVGGPATDGGSAVMYLPGKVMKSGTSVDPDQAVRSATATTYVIDMNQTSPAPTWRTVAPMNYARTFHSLTVLPDGTVLATGGGPTTAATDTAAGVLRAELWSPTTETWTLLPAMSVARLYHSEALLLPDGRVAVMGGGRFDDVTVPTDQFNAQIFSPPYLFKGARPTITSAPTTLTYGQAFSVQTPDAARIGSVSLVRFGATTHSFNAGQRFVPLSFTASSGTLTVTAPASANFAPGGNYMLFILDSSGVPSVAAIVHF